MILMWRHRLIGENVCQSPVRFTSSFSQTEENDHPTMLGVSMVSTSCPTDVVGFLGRKLLLLLCMLLISESLDLLKITCISSLCVD